MALIIGAVIIGGGWFVSNEIKKGALEIEHGDQIFDLEVVDILSDKITLHVTPLTGEDNWEREGKLYRQYFSSLSLDQ